MEREPTTNLSFTETAFFSSYVYASVCLSGQPTKQYLYLLLFFSSEMATEDEFTFHVSLAETKVPSEFRFRFRIVSLRLEQLQPNSLFLNETTQGLLALHFRTFPLSLSPSSIKYTLVHPPRYGYLTYALNAAQQITQFTQADLTSAKVMYSFKLTPYSPMTDYFLFNVSTSHLEMSLTSGPFRCDIHHSTRKKPTGVTIKPLIVTEGKDTHTNTSTNKTRVCFSI